MLEKVILGVVVGVLRYFMDRHAHTNAAKAEVYRELWTNAKKAYEWEAQAATAPDGGAALRVQPGSSGIVLQDHGPNTERPAPPT